jgi:hypothetical protein
MPKRLTRSRKSAPALTPNQLLWRQIKARIDAGLCRECGKKRGKGGTAQHCAACKERHNARLRERYKLAYGLLKAHKRDEQRRAHTPTAEE